MGNLLILNCEKIKLNYDVVNFKEKIIRFLVQELLPTTYLEAFKDIKQDVEQANLPNGPIKIFTSNCSQDTVFKYWLADSINRGSKFFHGQHGAGYGMVSEHNNLKIELSICDKYLSWGWRSKEELSNKILPCVALPFIKEKIQNKISGKDILIVPTVIDYYLFKNELRRVDKVNYDLSIVDDLIKNLDPDKAKNLIFKPHPIEIRKIKEFSYLNYVKENYPHLKIAEYHEQLSKLINKSKISIFLYLATPFLENLALNKPSIMIYHYGFEKL